MIVIIALWLCRVLGDAVVYYMHRCFDDTTYEVICRYSYFACLVAILFYENYTGTVSYDTVE